MDFPPDAVRTNLAVTSSAVAHTITTGTLVAGPAVGHRYRVWAFAAWPTDTAQAIANWRAEATVGIGGGTLLALTGSNFATPNQLYLPGGFLMGDTVAVGFLMRSALASATFQLQLYTTIEATA